MKTSALITEMNRRIAAAGLDPLDAEQVALLMAGTDASQIAGIFDELRDRCGVDCDDLRTAGALKHELTRLGFALHGTGGGCVAYVLPLRDVPELLESLERVVNAVYLPPWLAEQARAAIAKATAPQP